MEIERVTHYVDNVLTQAEARMGLRNTRLLVAWYTNQKNDQSVVHSHPYHELVLPIDGSVYLVHVGELIYFPAQIYHAGIFNIDNDHSDRLVIQIDDALWQACRRNANLKNAAWMHSITVLDPDVCNKWDFQSLFVRMAQSQELPAQMRDIVFEAQVSEMMLLITLATGSGQTTAPSSTNVLVQRAVSYLQAHYQDPTLTTVKLAQELYASREHLSRAFKECTMESIHSYLTHLRMQHCRKALEDGVSVLNACTESGFPDYSSFLKTFRRLYGITPAEYRSQKWYTNQKNDQSVVHSHPYHELVLPIDGSVYLVHVGELIYFPAQIYHAGIFNIDNDHSDRLVIQIDDALWQACRRNANLKNAAWMHSITVLDPDVCNKWDFQSLFVRMAQSQELPAQMRDIVFEAQVSEMMLLITLATGSGQTTAPSSTNVLVQRAVSYLQAHYQDPTLTTVKLAQELYASREHLSRAFKECTMESIHSYLTHLRMQHCRKALEDGVSVLNACTESGFPDYSSFLKTFRRLYGITPAEYRSQNRKKV